MEMDLLTVADAAKVVSGIGPTSITPTGIRMAARRGTIAVNQRTRSGMRLFSIDEVVRFAAARGRK